MKSLENLESEIIQITSEIRKSDFVQLFKYDRSIDSSPLRRIKKFMSMFQEKTIHKGIYVFDPDSISFKKVDQADHIQFNFIPHNSSNYSLLISDYQSKDLTIKPNFPLHFKMELLKDGDTKFTIHYKATTNGHFPSSMILNFQSTQYNSQIEINYKHKIQKGKLTIYSKLSDHEEEIEEGKFSVNLKFFKSGYSIKDIHFKIRLFDVLFYGDIEYGKINPGSRNYSQVFNKHCKILLKNISQNKIIGKVILMPLPENNDQEFFIQYADQSSEPIRNYIN